MTSTNGQPEVTGDNNGNNNKVKPKLTLHSILINSKSLTAHETDDEDFFSRGQMRPRANTEPMSPRPTLNRLHSLHVHFDLPDIIVDDCSDNDEENVDRSRPEEINRELANTEQGAFFVFQSPPRERSNTCPKNMFSKRRRAKNRPATPPPADNVPHDFPRHPSWEKVSFSPHSLTKVSEDIKEVKEIVTGAQESVEKTITSSTTIITRTKSISPTRSRRTVHIQPRGTKTTELRNRNIESPSSSPKRTGTGSTKLPNGHVSRQTPSTREAIHTTG